ADVVEDRLSFESPLKVFIGDGFLQVQSRDGIATYPVNGATGAPGAHWSDFLPFHEDQNAYFERKDIVEGEGTSSRPVVGDSTASRFSYLGDSGGKLKWIEARISGAPIEILTERDITGTVGNNDGDMIWLREKKTGEIRPYIRCQDLRKRPLAPRLGGLPDFIGEYASAGVSATGFSFDRPERAAYADGHIVLTGPLAGTGDAYGPAWVEAGKYLRDGKLDCSGFDFFILEGMPGFAVTRAEGGRTVRSFLMRDQYRDSLVLHPRKGKGALELGKMPPENSPIPLGIETGHWKWQKISVRDSVRSRQIPFEIEIRSVIDGKKRAFNRSSGSFADSVYLSIGVASQGYGTMELAANLADGSVKRFFYRGGALAQTAMEAPRSETPFFLKNQTVWESGGRRNEVKVSSITAGSSSIDAGSGWSVLFISYRIQSQSSPRMK
ncbi:MAG TPA: hypothetical protein VGB38_00680, partial [bacterium]